MLEKMQQSGATGSVRMGFILYTLVLTSAVGRFYKRVNFVLTHCIPFHAYQVGTH